MRKDWTVLVLAALLMGGVSLAGCKCCSEPASTASACAFCAKTGVACKECTAGACCAKCTECAKCPDCSADKACSKCMDFANSNLAK
jgi:hypothetical protein